MEYKYLMRLLFNWYTVLGILIKILPITELSNDLNLSPEFINMISFTILIPGVPDMTFNLKVFVLTG